MSTPIQPGARFAHRSSDGLDARRKRILFRSQHRGIKEMDLLMGGYVAAQVAVLDDVNLDRLEHLMNAGDADLLNWITGKEPVPAEYDTELFRAVRVFHGVNTDIDTAK